MWIRVLRRLARISSRMPCVVADRCGIRAPRRAAARAGAGRRPGEPPPRANLPRTADGKPDLGGIWQVRNTAASDLLDHAAKLHMPAGSAVVAGNDIPYQPWAAAKKIENFQNRATADPLAQCFMPGVPRIMYLDFPFQIFQTPQMIAMTFEWSSVHRQIYTDGILARRRHRFLDGRLARPLGGRHAGGRRRRTTTTRPGSTWPATFTARR